MSNQVVTRRLQIIIDESGAGPALDRLQVKEKKLVDEIERGTKAGKDMTKAIGDLETVRGRITGLEGIISGKLAPTLNQTAAAANKLHKELNSMSADAPGYAAKFAAFQEVSATLDTMKQKVSGFRSAASSAFQQIKQIALGVTVGNTITAITQSITGFISGSISNAGKLSDQLADLQRVTGLTSAEVLKLNKGLSEINTRTSTEGLRQIAIVAGKLGVAKDDILSFTEATDKLVVSLGDELGNADEITTQLGKILNVFNGKVDGENLTKLGNAFVTLANAGVATGGFIADFTQRVAGLSKASGISLGTTVGLAAGFEELGLKSESSATALQKLISTIAGDLPKAAKIAGIETEKFAKLFAEAPQEALIKFAEGLTKNKKSFAEITASFKDAGEEGARVVQTLNAIGQRGDFLRQKIELGSKAIQENTAINAAFALKNETLGASIDKLGKLIAKAFNSSILRDATNGIIKSLIDLFDTTNSTAKAFDEANKSFEDTTKSVDELVARYRTLNNQSSLNKDEQHELYNIIQKIVDLVPSAATAFDKYGAALDISTGKIADWKAKQTRFIQDLNRDAINSLEEDIKRSLNLIGVYSENLAIKARDNDVEAVAAWRSAIAKQQEISIKAADDLINKYGVELPASLIKSINAVRSQAGLAPIIANELKITDPLLKIADASQFDIPNPDAKKTPATLALTDDQKEAAKKASADRKRELEQQKKDLEALLKDIDKLENDSYKRTLDTYQAALFDIATKYADTIARVETTVFKSADERMKTRVRVLKNYVSEMQQASKLLGPDIIAAPVDQNADPIKDKTDKEVQALTDAQKKKDQLTTAEQNVFKAQLAERLNLSRANIQARIEEEKKLLDIQMVAEISVITSKAGSQAEIDAVKEKYKLLFAQLEGSFRDFQNSFSKTFQDIFDGIQQGTIDGFAKMANGILSIAQLVNETLNQLTQNQIDSLQQRYNADTQHYQDQLDQKVISRAQYDQKTKTLDKKFDQEKKQLEKQAFRRQQLIDESTAAMNTALAITNALSTVHPYPLAVVAAVAAGALGVAQEIAIASEKPPEYGGGGLLPQGSSHAEGGIGLRDNRTGKYVATIEGGEPIISKGVYAANKPLVDGLLNKGYTRDFTPITPGWVSQAPKQMNFALVNKSISAPAPMFADGGILPTVASAEKNNQETTDVMKALLNRLNQPIYANVIYTQLEATAKEINSIRTSGMLS